MPVACPPHSGAAPGTTGMVPGLVVPAAALGPEIADATSPASVSTFATAHAHSDPYHTSPSTAVFTATHPPMLEQGAALAPFRQKGLTAAAQPGHVSETPQSLQPPFESADLEGSAHRRGQSL